MRRKVRVSERRHILFIFTLMPVFLVTAFFGNSGGSHGLSTEQLEIVAASEDSPATRGKDRAAEPPDKPVSTVPAMTSTVPSSSRTETTTTTTVTTTKSAETTVISSEEKMITTDLTETILSETVNEAVYEPEPEAEAVYEPEYGAEAVYEPEPEPEAVYESEQITYESESEMSYLGNLKITGYTATGNLTASGVMPYVGGVAINSSFISDYGLSYGDTIYIDGLGYYTLNDTGCSYGVVDVFASTVDECYALTSYADVYLVN